MCGLSRRASGTADLVQKAAGVFGDAAEVVHDARGRYGAHHAAVDVESLPSGLAELYMDRYRHVSRTQILSIFVRTPG